METITSLLWDLKNIVFPDFCPACSERILPKGRLLCTSCLFELPFTDHFDINENKVAAHFWGRFPIKNAAGLLYFKRSGFVQNLLHELKYRQNKKIGTTFGKIAGEKMLTSPFFRDIDLIIPVPLHPAKEYLRGYNQSFVFAQGISSMTNVPVHADILSKNKKNESQTGKNRSERLNNVESVYYLKKSGIITGKNILLVDDVITTGSTLEACLSVLKQDHPKSMSIVTLACAL